MNISIVALNHFERPHVWRLVYVFTAAYGLSFNPMDGRSLGRWFSMRRGAFCMTSAFESIVRDIAIQVVHKAHPSPLAVPVDWHKTPCGPAINIPVISLTHTQEAPYLLLLSPVRPALLASSRPPYNDGPHSHSICSLFSS